MTTEKMFESAIRNKFRFPFKGQVSTEDLWDLTVKDLDSIFKTLNAQKKRVSEESLLSVITAEDEELESKIEIIKHIVSVKLVEAEARVLAKEKKEQKQKIMSIIASKKDEALQNKSIDELEAILGELDN
jgi:CHASE3 domain sensor protein